MYVEGARSHCAEAQYQMEVSFEHHLEVVHEASRESCFDWACDNLWTLARHCSLVCRAKEKCCFMRSECAGDETLLFVKEPYRNFGRLATMGPKLLALD